MKKLLNLVLAMGLTMLSLTASATIKDLFISEYVEGSHFDKAIELFNGKDRSVNLADYRLDLYLNGSSSVNLSFTLSGFLPPNSTYVIANARAASEIIIVADATKDGLFFNGNDVIVLSHKGKVIDSLGQINLASNEVGHNAVLNQRGRIMRRLAALEQADSNIYDQADIANQWQSVENRLFEGLGNHIANERFDVLFSAMSPEDGLNDGLHDSLNDGLNGALNDGNSHGSDNTAMPSTETLSDNTPETPANPDASALAH